jgi:hypothetical protein
MKILKWTLKPLPSGYNDPRNLERQNPKIPVYATLTPVVYPFVTLNALKGTQLLMPSQNMERPPLAGSLA